MEASKQTKTMTTNQMEEGRNQKINNEIQKKANYTNTYIKCKWTKSN